MTITVKPQQRLSCLSGDDVMMFPPACPGGGRWSWQDGFREALLQESDRVVLCLGERGEPSCAPERSPLPCVLSKRKKTHPDWTRAPRRLVPPLPRRRVHLAFPPRPAPVSRQMTQFDTLAGRSGRIMFLRDHRREKAISISLRWLLFLCCCSLNTTMMRLWRDFIALGLKLITPARHPSIKEITKWHFVLGLRR